MMPVQFKAVMKASYLVFLLASIDVTRIYFCCIYLLPYTVTEGTHPRFPWKRSVLSRADIIATGFLRSIQLAC